MAKELLGKPVIAALKEDLLGRIDALKSEGVVPALAIVRVGEREDDLSYERTALKRSEGLGVEVRRFVLPEDAGQAALMDVISQVNEDDSIHGCLIFRPLPRGYDEEAACEALDPAKDIDGIGRAALARVFTGRGEGFAPCTAAACLEMLDAYGIDAAGKRVAVVGRSLVIGRPVAMMLLERNATVTMCHSRTENLEAAVREADIVVLATGRAEAYGASCFREGQVVLDVGINVDAEGNLCGDADFDAAFEAVGEAGAVTPVPRGIGGVTTSVLMKHVVEAAEKSAFSRPCE
ncbi:MAG: bifunctional 5,10-methylenetetrahydrofolate dehydrogenase/5,10-methenyltetrahydrofolate cyclohydrolase [Slackia sp.]|nr:bifunctional 5,10-methylenetetrahydrofolate dehydrogenase/5,10-methenyltetrahydrofolate cyclohydrolase [Slackia sp.]